MKRSSRKHYDLRLDGLRFLVIDEDNRTGRSLAIVDQSHVATVDLATLSATFSRHGRFRRPFRSRKFPMSIPHRNTVASSSVLPMQAPPSDHTACILTK